MLVTHAVLVEYQSMGLSEVVYELAFLERGHEWVFGFGQIVDNQGLWLTPKVLVFLRS